MFVLFVFRKEKIFKNLIVFNCEGPMKQEILGMLSQAQFLYLIFDKDDNINK